MSQTVYSSCDDSVGQVKVRYWKVVHDFGWNCQDIVANFLDLDCLNSLLLSTVLSSKPYPHSPVFVLRYASQTPERVNCYLRFTQHVEPKFPRQSFNNKCALAAAIEKAPTHPQGLLTLHPDLCSLKKETASFSVRFASNTVQFNCFHTCLGSPGRVTHGSYVPTSTLETFDPFILARFYGCLYLAHRKHCR